MSKCMKLLTLVVAVGVLAGCEADEGDVPSVMDIRMIGVPADVTMAGVSTDPLAGVRIVRLSVEGPGMEPVSVAYDFLKDNGGQLPAFPEGYDRQVTVELCSKKCDESVAGDIVSRGRSAPETRFKGDGSRLVNVFVSPRNSVVAPVSLSADGSAWEASSMVRKERTGATVTALDDGRLLIVGGAKKKAEAKSWHLAADIDRLYADAEIYDPRTGKFTATGNSLNVARAFHQAVKLGGPNKKDGRVLILGGYAMDDGAIKPTLSVEIYDPLTDRFEVAEKELAGGGRALFTASLAWPDESIVMIAGGMADPAVAGGTWQLYKPGIGAIAAGPLMNSDNGQTGQIRYNHTATFLTNYGGLEDTPAYVLVGGENAGGTIAAAEAYLLQRNVGGKPYNLALDEAATPDLPVSGRTMHQSVYVASLGLIYVIGGFMEQDLGNPTDRIEVYWVGKKSFQGDTGMFLGSPRGGLTATLTDASTILVSGGYGATGPTVDTDVLTVNRECWQEGDPPQERCGRVPRAFDGKTPVLEASRAGHVAVLDPTRRVFLVGGLSGGNAAAGPILYNPD